MIKFRFLRKFVVTDQSLDRSKGINQLQFSHSAMMNITPGCREN